MDDRQRGRIGDSPVIGAGTYADNATCAVRHGHGEFFIRFAAGASRRPPRPWGRSRDAAAEVIAARAAAGGSGGLVAVDHDGAIALPFSSPGMYRGYVRGDRVVHTAIFPTGILDEAYRAL